MSTKSDLLKVSAQIGTDCYGEALNQLEKKFGEELPTRDAYNAIFCMALNFMGNALNHMCTISKTRSLVELANMVSEELKYSFKNNMH
jgi:hypothetical protein